MTGKPGRSGGARSGSGRKPQSWRLRTDDELLAQELDTTGKPAKMPRLAPIEVESRTVLIVHMDDGTDLRLVRV